MNVAAVQVADADILSALAAKTYDEVSRELGVSRGRIWKVACKHNARKHEARIQERAAERKQRQREFLAEVVNSVQTMDVLDFLGSVPDGSAQLILTSPPYNQGKRYGGGESADNHSFHYYLGWMLQVASESARVLKDGGTLFLQVGTTRAPDGRSLYPIDSMLHQHLVGMGLTFLNRIVWPISHGLTPTRTLAHRYETALVFSKGEQSVFNPDAARQPTLQPAKRAFKGPRLGQITSHPLGKFPSDVWSDIGHCGHNSVDKAVGGGHPAQFPAKLARRAILLYSNPQDLVIDPFCGSGTTAVECKRTGRAFLGADLFYEDVRRKRLAAISPDLVSELPGVTDESIAVWQAEVQVVRQAAPALTTSAQRRLRAETLDLFDGFERSAA